MAQRDDARFLQVTHLGLGQLPVPDPPVAELDRVVAVGGLGLDLGHDVSLAETHHGDGHDEAVGLEVGHHAELGAHHADPGLH